jgi:hypothetical protein
MLFCVLLFEGMKSKEEWDRLDNLIFEIESLIFTGLKEELKDLPKDVWEEHYKSMFCQLLTLKSKLEDIYPDKYV